jgi:signal transduction histidine kinase
VSRLPIRLRLTAAFAAAMVLVLAGAALFVYVQLRSNLDEVVNVGLRARADAVAASAAAAVPELDSPSAAAIGEPDEAFAQVLTVGGRVVASTGAAREPTLTPAQLRSAARAPIVVERNVPGLDDTARILARPVSRSEIGPRTRVVVVGQSLGDRNEALAGLVRSFALGGPVAVLLASLLGYWLARAGLRPIEAMRRRAADVSLSGDSEPLPLPATNDEVRRLGETLNDMLERLRRSFDRERRFVADASHELRTPIAVLKTELEAALRSGDYGPAARAPMVAAAEEVDQLAQLAEDLLVLARAGDGKLPLRPEPVGVTELLEGLRDRFADRAGQQRRGLSVDSPNGLELAADPLRLRQALGNLVDNALRHGAGEVRLTARTAGDTIELAVSDGGPGFAPEIAGRAFERFTRGDEARTRGGAGLGLALVAEIAAAHGGRAEIVPGEGATIRLSMPAAATAAGRR